MTQNFFVGDVVSSTNKRFRKTQIISEVMYCGKGVFKYSTTEQAWFDDNELNLVSKACDESFKKLDKRLKILYTDPLW